MNHKAAHTIATVWNASRLTKHLGCGFEIRASAEDLLSEVVGHFANVERLRHSLSKWEASSLDDLTAEGVLEEWAEIEGR